MFTILGHLGVWAGLYALASFICLCQLAGLTPGGFLPRWEAMACLLLTATAVYSVDRVKLISRWLDPADIAAQPARYQFLTRRTGLVRAFAFVLLVAAAAVGFRIGAIVPLLVVIAAASTVIYAPKPRNAIARVKDRLWLKNAYVAVGMATFAAVLAVLSVHPGSVEESIRSAMNLQPVLGIAFTIVALRIFFDAALCDIDDEPTDRQFRTETFATSLGSSRVWNWAGLGRFPLAVALLIATPLPFVARCAWSAAMVLGMFALRWRHPVRIRDTVDIRFLPEAVFVTLLLFLASYSSSFIR
ncbi:MAG: hypothetical protein ACREJD_00980 [Phycisphaerales bacterium]